MSKTLKWVLIGLAIALAAFLLTMLIGGMFWMHNGVGISRFDGYYPHGGMMRWPMVGVFGLFRALISLGILVLAVFGVIYLVRGGAKKSSYAPLPPVPPVAAPRVCVVCGKPLPAEGEFCPHCGAQQS